MMLYITLSRNVRDNELDVSNANLTVQDALLDNLMSMDKVYWKVVAVDTDKWSRVICACQQDAGDDGTLVIQTDREDEMTAILNAYDHIAARNAVRLSPESALMPRVRDGTLLLAETFASADAFREAYQALKTPDGVLEAYKRARNLN